MQLRHVTILAALALASTGLLPASPLVGKWTGEWDSQIGKQKYTFEFKAEGDKLLGQATFERSNGNGSVALRNVTVAKDDVSFIEPLNFDGNEVLITYTGKLAGEELKLTRKVGDFATYPVVVKRDTGLGTAKPDAKPAAPAEAKPAAKPAAPADPKPATKPEEPKPATKK